MVRHHITISKSFLCHLLGAPFYLLTFFCRFLSFSIFVRSVSPPILFKRYVFVCVSECSLLLYIFLCTALVCFFIFNVIKNIRETIVIKEKRKKGKKTQISSYVHRRRLANKKTFVIFVSIQENCTFKFENVRFRTFYMIMGMRISVSITIVSIHWNHVRRVRTTDGARRSLWR